MMTTRQLVITSQELVEGEKRKTYKNSAFKEGKRYLHSGACIPEP